MHCIGEIECELSLVQHNYKTLRMEEDSQNVDGRQKFEGQFGLFDRYNNYPDLNSVQTLDHISGHLTPDIFL